jgi:hypothetical protein
MDKYYYFGITLENTREWSKEEALLKGKGN